MILTLQVQLLMQQKPPVQLERQKLRAMPKPQMTMTRVIVSNQDA